MDQLSFVYGMFREGSVHHGGTYPRIQRSEERDVRQPLQCRYGGAVHGTERPGTVTILRTRPYGLREEFEQGRTFETTYHTPYLDIPLRIRTRRLAVFRKGRGWTIRLRYDSELGGEAGRIEVTVEVEPV